MNKKSFLVTVFMIFVMASLLPAKTIAGYKNLEKADYKSDFYLAVNKDWFIEQSKNNERALISSFQESQNIFNAKVLDFLEKFEPKNNNERFFKNFYDTCMDVEERNKNGLEPVKKYLELINNATSLEELLEAETVIYNETGFSNLLFVEGRYIKILDVYLGHTFVGWNNISYIGKLLNLPVVEIQNLGDFNTILSRIQSVGITPRESKTLLSILIRDNFKTFNFEKVVKERGNLFYGSYNVGNIEVFNQMVDKLQNTDLELLKKYECVTFITYFSYFLDTEMQMFFYNSDDERYTQKEILQIETMIFIKQYLYYWAEDIYNHNLLDRGIVQSVTDFCHEVVDEYKAFVNEFDYYPPAIKKRIIHILDTMNFYVAEFPMNLRDYYDLPDNSGKNSFENACIAIKQIQNYYKSLRNNFIYDEVRSMSSLEANAYYLGDRNSFYICAALLNEPFYSKSYSYEHLLASLGTVIAHEISHSFDTNFMVYTTGWGNGEFYKYQEFERSIIRLYDGVEDAYKIKNNGKRTMAEANADLFAVSCVLKILKKHVENPDYKEFFTLFAQNYRNITSKSSLEYNMLKDGHPLPRARVNCCVANFEEFYDAFDITSKDKMYVEPEKRIKLW